MEADHEFSDIKNGADGSMIVTVIAAFAMMSGLAFMFFGRIIISLTSFFASIMISYVLIGEYLQKTIASNECNPIAEAAK